MYKKLYTFFRVQKIYTAIFKGIKKIKLQKYAHIIGIKAKRHSHTIHYIFPQNVKVFYTPTKTKKKTLSGTCMYGRGS